MSQRHTAWVIKRTAIQLFIVAVFLALWQWLPTVPALRGKSNLLDPFFISSPSSVAKTIKELTVGGGQGQLIWSALKATMLAALSGTFAAIVVGAVLGLVLSNSRAVADVVRPFITALNAVPRIAIIPIIILVVKGSAAADATTAFTVVVFLVFFNSFEGGRSVPFEMLANARLLGAGSWSIMWFVRAPLAMAWTFAALPTALAFGLVGSITAELFTGSEGIGQVLTQALDTANASLTFAVVILISIVGVILVIGSDLLRSRLFAWRDNGAMGL